MSGLGGITNDDVLGARGIGGVSSADADRTGVKTTEAEEATSKKGGFAEIDTRPWLSGYNDAETAEKYKALMEELKALFAKDKWTDADIAKVQSSIESLIQLKNKNMLDDKMSVGLDLFLALLSKHNFPEMPLSNSFLNDIKEKAITIDYKAKQLGIDDIFGLAMINADIAGKSLGELLLYLGTLTADKFDQVLAQLKDQLKLSQDCLEALTALREIGNQHSIRESGKFSPNPLSIDDIPLDLQAKIAQDLIKFTYQPIVDSAKGEMARWEGIFDGTIPRNSPGWTKQDDVMWRTIYNSDGSKKHGSLMEITVDEVNRTAALLFIKPPRSYIDLDRIYNIHQGRIDSLNKMDEDGKQWVFQWVKDSSDGYKNYYKDYFKSDIPVIPKGTEESVLKLLATRDRILKNMEALAAQGADVDDATSPYGTLKKVVVDINKFFPLDAYPRGTTTLPEGVSSKQAIDAVNKYIISCNENQSSTMTNLEGAMTANQNLSEKATDELKAKSTVNDQLWQMFIGLGDSLKKLLEKLARGGS